MITAVLNQKKINNESLNIIKTAITDCNDSKDNDKIEKDYFSSKVKKNVTRRNYYTE